MAYEPFAELVEELAELPSHAKTAAVRDWVDELELGLLALPQYSLNEQHSLVDGLYVRTVVMKAGSLVTGRVHKKSGLAIIQSGDVSILTESGLERIKAPHMSWGIAGIKRVLYMHEDTVFTTVHRTDKLTLDEIEDDITQIEYLDEEVVL